MSGRDAREGREPRSSAGMQADGPSSPEVLSRAARGDEAAWRAIVGEYSGRVYGLLRSQGADPELAEEVTQSVFCTLAAKLPEYVEGGRFESWLFRIAMNRLRDDARRKRRQAKPAGEKESAVQLGLRPMEAHLLNTRPGGPGPLRLTGPLVKTVATATVEHKPPTQSDRLIKALAQYPLRCEPSGAVSVGWIVAVMQAAGLSGPELFAALKAHGGPAWAAAEIYTAEKTQMHPHPKML